MEISILGLIGIGLGTMFFGYFFGLFEGRGQGYKKRAKEESFDRLPLPSQPKQGSPESGIASSSKNLLELGRTVDGRAFLQVDGQRVDASGVTPQHRKRLIELMVMLRPWIEPAASPQSTPPTPGGSAPRSAAEAGIPATPAQARIASAAVTPVATGTPAPSVPAPATLSLVQQIDAILQTRLAGSNLAGRGIRLAESLHGGAIVFVGQAQYDGVDKVPDPEIQSAIRSAIAEWEKTSAPG